jgi:hypothetical protein
MLMKMMNGPFVGADLSGTPPIDRPYEALSHYPAHFMNRSTLLVGNHQKLSHLANAVETDIARERDGTDPMEAVIA